MVETRALGFESCAPQDRARPQVRALLVRRGLPSVAAEGFQAAGVVVSYTDDDPGLHSGKAFLAEGLQSASGVPLQCDEPADFKTFRLGLFGLEKLQHVDRTVANLEAALDHRRTRPTRRLTAGSHERSVVRLVRQPARRLPLRR